MENLEEEEMDEAEEEKEEPEEIKEDLACPMVRLAIKEKR